MSKKKEMGKVEEQKVLKPNFIEPEAKPFIPEGHKLPKTRREFLAHGFISGMATMVLPSFTTILASQNSAFAQSTGCELPEFQGGIPYIIIDGGGGMNIAGSNVIVGFEDSETQESFMTTGWASSDFIRLGITPENHPSNSGKIIEKYGLKFHAGSGILAGMDSILEGQLMPNGKAISAGVDGVVYCTRTADDTAANPINTAYMVNKAGAKGELVQLIGNQATDTGGRSAAPPDQVNLTLRPTRVASNNDATGLLSLGNELSGTNYLKGSQERIKTFMERIGNMSKTKLDEINKKAPLGQIQQVLNCSFDNAKQLFQVYSAENLNPANDPAIVSAFNGGSANAASVAKLVLDKIAGAGTITFGGCDYHGGAPANTHNVDFQAGEYIGQIILAAATKQTNCVVELITDGGVVGDSGGTSAPVLTANGTMEKVMWTGDSGTRSASIQIVYKHNHDGSSLVREDANNVPRRMVGSFIKAGGVNLDTIIGNSTVKLWQAKMLNYLALMGREGEFDSIYGLASLSPDEVQKLVRFKQIE